MDPAKVLRDQERLLAMEYGATHTPHPLGGEDLDCEDPRDASHWVRVYSELVEFMEGLLEEQRARAIDDPADPALQADQLPAAMRAMTLQARVLELHLAYWTQRLARLGGGSDPPRGETEREGPS